jgi:adenylosuccinate lyase
VSNSIQIQSGASTSISVKQTGYNKSTVINQPVKNTIDISGLKGGGDLSYVHNQTTASDVWNVTHSLIKKPAVIILDDDGYEIEADVQHLSDNAVTITFSEAITGTAHFN